MPGTLSRIAGEGAPLCAAGQGAITLSRCVGEA